MKLLQLWIGIIVFLSLLPFNYSQAPSSPPVNITVSVINSTAFNSKWRIPDEDEHNGAPEFVEIRLIGKDIKTNTEITIPISTNESSSKSIILSPLQEYVLYSVSFAVKNGEGISAFSEPLYLRTNPAAPKNTPENVTTKSLNSTSIRITFYPPPEIDQNGPITLYSISFIGEIFDTVPQFVNISFINPIYPAVAPISVNLTGLQEYNNYTIRLRATNGEGSTESTTGVMQITDQAGSVI